MAMSDEVRSNPRYKPREKKSFAESFLPMRGDTPNQIVSKVIVLISIMALIVCGVILGVYFYHIFEAKQNNSKILSKYNEIGSRASGEVPQADLTLDENGEIIRSPLVTMPFAVEMLEINKDYAGYVSIPNCINEAVVQGTDNEYYLNKNIYDQTRQCGTVFADYRNVVNDYADLQSDNIILYGHNQKDGTMFGEMDYYKWDLKYWLKNPFIYFDNKYEQNVYVIIASFVVNDDPKDDNGNVFDYYNYIKFNDTYTYDNFIKELNERTQFYTGIDVNENDKFLTLSTCSYEWDTSRHVIIGRKLRAGETTENIDLSGFEVNPNPKWPAIYYKYNGGAYIPSA
ncbi:MAG: class B sortase [Oscillospiraceae bacterium]|nr:class B sortase [Oscillospiraceae bacterium]